MCDNLNHCHDNVVINETKDGIRVFCKNCKEINIIRMDETGRSDNRLYSKVFKKDILQPSENLYYKYNNKMSIV